MAKYCFKVYLHDGSSRGIVPSSLDENHTNLSDIDNYVYNCESYTSLCNSLANELHIKPEQIEKIKILQTRTENEFSIIIQNPYLISVLPSIKNKRINNYKSYPMDTIVVSSDNPSYIEMKNYLFQNVRNNYEYFLSEIYNYNNDFSRLLFCYGKLYQQGLYQEEDLRDLKEVEDKILVGLSIYKNYRGLCKSRYDFENNYFLHNSINKKNSQKENSFNYNNPKYDEKYFSKRESFELNQYTNELGEEKEEFLDEEELESVQDYGKRR